MTLVQHPPRSHAVSKLVSHAPTASVPASVNINHVQLRDLLVCPAQRGVLWYVGERSIVEQDILSNTPQSQRTLALLTFTPVTLTTLRLASSCPTGKDTILVAAGGQNAELFLAAYSYTPRRTRQPKAHSSSIRQEPTIPATSPSTFRSSPESSPDNMDEDRTEKEDEEAAGYSTSIWQHFSSLIGSINNNVLLYVPPSPLSSSAFKEAAPPAPRLVVSNNDSTVKFFDISLACKGLIRHGTQRVVPHSSGNRLEPRYWRPDSTVRPLEGEGLSEKAGERIVRYERVGLLRLTIPVNHTSISPDGSTILSCGDSPTIYLHRILPIRDGSSLLFEPLATLNVPAPSPLLSPPHLPPSLFHTSPTSHSRAYVPSYHPPYPPYPDPASYLPYAFVGGSWQLVPTIYPTPSLYEGYDVAEAPLACFATAWSADGTRFAVASQEGALRVWDIRSKEPLIGAGWDTGPRNTSGELEGNERESAWFDYVGGAPPWGIRSLKFVKNSSGKELLVAAEHVSRVHIVNADTFATHDVLRIPHVRPSTSSAPCRDDPRFLHSLPGWPTNASSGSSPQLQARSRGLPSSDYRTPHPVSPGDEGNPPPQIVFEAQVPAQSRGHRARWQTSEQWELLGEDSMDPLLRRARAEVRAAANDRILPVHINPRRRRTALLPPEMHSSGGNGYERVLSSSSPFTRSPEPEANRPLPETENETGQARYEANETQTARGLPLTLPQRMYSRLVQAQARNRQRQAELASRAHSTVEPSTLSAHRRRSPIRPGPELPERERDNYRLQLSRQPRDQSSTEMRMPPMDERLRVMRAVREQERNDELRREESRISRVSSEERRSEVMNHAGRERPMERTLERARLNALQEGIQDENAILIPPMSSARSEEDIRDVLASHGISSVATRNDGAQREGIRASNIELRRPSLSSASATSSTSLSADASTRAHAGSQNDGESSSTGASSIGVWSRPSPADVLAAQAALRAIEEYRMDIDEEYRNGGYSDATEVDCMEPDSPETPVMDPVSISNQSSSLLNYTADEAASSSTNIPASSSNNSAFVPSNFPSSPTSISEATSTSTLASSSSSSTSPTSTSPTSTPTQTLPPCRDLIESTDRLDIAGVAFDPRGAYMYVATIEGITEWKVEGAETRWWSASGYL